MPAALQPKSPLEKFWKYCKDGNIRMVSKLLREYKFDVNLANTKDGGKAGLHYAANEGND